MLPTAQTSTLCYLCSMYTCLISSVVMHRGPSSGGDRAVIYRHFFFFSDFLRTLNFISISLDTNIQLKKDMNQSEEIGRSDDMKRGELMYIAPPKELEKMGSDTMLEIKCRTKSQSIECGGFPKWLPLSSELQSFVFWSFFLFWLKKCTWCCTKHFYLILL